MCAKNLTHRILRDSSATSVRSFSVNSVLKSPGLGNRKLSVQVTTYQTLHTFSAGLVIGAPGLHAKAWPNSGTFTIRPFTRYR